MRDSFRRRFVVRARELFAASPRVTDPKRVAVYGGPPPGWTEDPAWDLRAVPMRDLRRLLADMRAEEGKPGTLQADGMPPFMDVNVMLKGMHSGGYSREDDVLAFLDGLDFYLETGRDPYMHWGPGKRWRP